MADSALLAGGTSQACAAHADRPILFFVLTIDKNKFICLAISPVSGSCQLYLGNLRGRRSFSITRLININKFTYQGRVQPSPYPQKQPQGVLITFNRPAEMNAFGRPLMVELRQGLGQSGRRSGDPRDRVDRRRPRFFRRHGSGQFTHITIASQDAVIAQLEVRHGSNTGFMWTQLAGFNNALHYSITGDHIDAQEAPRIGLFNKVVTQYRNSNAFILTGDISLDR